MKKKESAAGPYRWAGMIFCIAVALSAVLSLVAQFLLDGTGLLTAVCVLMVFILLGIGFDMIGMAAAVADPKPLHSMASHKVPGAKEALKLVRNASRVSSVCNDVVGDICGIVSGVTGAVIVSFLHSALNIRTLILSVGVTALISGLTIGGKALSKTFAIRRGTQVIWWTGRFLYWFRPRNLRRNGRRKKRSRKDRKRETVKNRTRR